MNEPNIALRSDEVEDILGRPPSWIVRWGISMLATTLLALLALAWLVEYSDVLESSITVTTPSPAMSVEAQASGPLVVWNVKQGMVVEKDDLLAVVQGGADQKDMEWLAQQVERAKESQRPFAPSRNLNLGEWQNVYSEYDRAYKDYNYALRGSFEKQQVEQIFTQTQSIQRKIRVAEEQKRNLKEDLPNIQRKIDRYKQLENSGVDTDSKLQRAQDEYHSTLRKIDDLDANIVSHESDIEALEAQKIEIQKGKVEGGNDRLMRVLANMDDLGGAVREWEALHLMKAPVAGRVNLFAVRQQGQYVSQGQEVMVIIPEQDEILGRMEIPVTGAGKVEKGDPVNIMLHEYPSKEFGVVKGEIRHISLLPKDNRYLVEVALPNGLMTTHKKKLDFKQEMSGMAEIITDQQRLLSRILEQFKGLVKDQK